MASKRDKYIEDLIKSIRSKSTTEIPEKQAYDPAKQAAGLEARLEASGVKEDKRDTRNIVEKALNLTPKQNVLFDVFEIINRPQQMLFQGIKASQEGEDVGKAIRKGFGGVGDDVRFKEILHNSGMEDTGKDFGLDDVLGFAGDVLADPIDLALVVAAPFTGGASGAVLGAKKAIQAADTAADTVRGIDAALTVAKAANKTAEVAQLTKKLQQAQKTASKLQESKKLWQNLETAATNLTELKKIAKKTGNTDGLADALTAYKRAVQPLKKRMTPLEFTFKKVKGGFGKTINLADDGIEGVMTKLDGFLDDSRIKQVQKALDIDIKEARKLQDKFNAIRPWATKYADMKAAVNGIFDAAKAIPKGLWNKTKELTGSRKLAFARMSKLQLENVQDIAKVAKDMNLDPKDIERMLMRNYEFMKHSPDMKFADMFDSSYINRNPMTEQNYQAFKTYIRETFKDAEGFSKYGEAAIDDLFTVKPIKEGSKLKIWLPKQEDNNVKYLQEMLDDVNRDFAKVSRDTEKFGKRFEKLQANYNKLQESQAKALEFINKNSNRFATIDGKTVAILTSDELASLKKLGIDLKPDKNGVVTHESALKKLNARIKNADNSLAKIDNPIISSVESKLAKSGVTPVKFNSVASKQFKESLEKVKPNLVNPQSVTVYDDYSNAKTFLSADGKVGFAIQPDGNIISVFSDPSNKGSLKTIMPMAIANGGTKLDAYAVKSLSKQDAKTLVNLYEGYGFKPVAKVKWADEAADAAWDYEKFGRPDIVFMVHNGDSVDNVIKNVNKYKTTPLDEIKYVNEWDDGVALQNKAVKQNTVTSKIKVGKVEMTPDQAKKSLTSLKEKMTKAKDDVTKSKQELSKYINEASGAKLTKQADKMKELQDNLRPIVHDRVIPASRYYDGDDVLEMQEYFKSPEMEQLYKRFDERHTAMFQDLNDLLGTALDGEGYMRHVLNDDYAQELRNLPKDVQTKLRDSGIIGNTSTFRGRAYQMSANEANLVRKQITQNMLETGEYSDAVKETLESLVDLDMFEVDAKSSTWDFIRNAPKEIEKGRRIEETLKASLANGVAGTMLDPEMLKPFEAMTKFENGKMVRLVDTSRQTLVSANDLYNKIDELGYAFQNEDLMQAIKAELQASKASQLVIDKNLYNLIGFTTDKTINEVAENTVKLIDKTNNMFKKFKLLSPGFQIRNLVGNFTNILLSGVNPYKIMDNNIIAHRVLTQGDALMTKRAKGLPLSAGELEILDLFEGFTREGFDQILGATDMANIASVYDIPADIAKMMRSKDKPKNLFKRMIRWNARTNELVDRQFRMSAYIYAQRNPEILTKVGVNTPAEFVRKVLFDPNDLSKVEQQYLKRLIPFYTFTKKNLAYQMRNVWDNPNRYNKLLKSVDGSWSMLDIDPKTDLEQYKRENMWIPVFVNQNGEYKALKANLPVGDFGEFISDPMKKIVSSTAPVIRTPFELTMNTQAFTQMPIQEFKGQRGYQLPFVGRKVEYGLSQLGLDVPIAAGYDLAKGAGQVVQGNIGQGLETGIGRSFLSSGSVEKARLSADYQRLNDLRDLMKYYKQEGKTILTLDEIANLQQDKSQSIIQRIRAIGRG